MELSQGVDVERNLK